MRLPSIPPGKSAGFYLYQHYHRLPAAEQPSFFAVLVAFEWGGLSTRDPASSREEAEALARDNLAFALERDLL